jgi:hypothetical protein
MSPAITASTATPVPTRNRIPTDLGYHTIAQQAGALGAVFPNSRIRMHASKLIWTGELHPSDLSRIYTVTIEYRRPYQPRVVVVSPELQPDAEGFLPHMYDDNSLCLHDRGQWKPQILIVDTIVPWAAEWLLHYEVWLATNTWYGDDPGDRRDPLDPVAAAAL